LAAHPAIADALAAGEISASWARQIYEWTDLLPEDARADADAILLAAAKGGVALKDLAGLAEEMRNRTARPDRDGDDDGFRDRSLSLAVTLGGVGRLRADLTPQATAALQAILDSLGKPAGPEDLRSKWQRQHDALEEALRRLIGEGCLPQRGGQPTQIQLHMTLDQLRGLPGASGLASSWPGAPAGPGSDCDASIVPVVTGHVDQEVVDRLAAVLLREMGQDGLGAPGSNVRLSQDGTAGPAGLDRAFGLTGTGPRDGAAEQAGADRDNRPGGLGGVAPMSDLAGVGRGPGWREPGEDADAAATRRELAERAARQLIIGRAVDVLSGPTGLAAYLRTGLLNGPAAAISLPLDVGTTTDTIPANLRRLVIGRDRCCRFPGCDQPALACQPHHIIPRAQGGRTSLKNLLLLCAFHHLIAVHRWGWELVLKPDGTVIATSPDRTRVFHSHSPPANAA
ncbi:MAG TPA: DUF222 domain-containing protein, partial [Streptosporangiaceae bacterium]